MLSPKVIYVSVFVVAFAICHYTLFHTKLKWNPRTLFIGLLLYIVTGGFLLRFALHTVWAWLFV